MIFDVLQAQVRGRTFTDMGQRIECWLPPGSYRTTERTSTIGVEIEDENGELWYVFPSVFEKHAIKITEDVK